ncbi:MAG: site-2 protease family protein [Thermoguttaceae bacterium]|jgi:Zn-dependent protease
MFGEPGPTQGDIHFKLLGMPIRIHPLFWLIAVVLGANSGGAIEVLIWVVAVLVSILIHELGHALVIRAFGFHPWIVLYGMGGLTCHDPAENYNSKANTPLGQISISIAGPLAGFILAALLVIVFYRTGYIQEIDFIPPIHLQLYWSEVTRLAQLFNYIIICSFFWGILNLLPVYPLDGGQIMREILLYFNHQEGVWQSLILSIFTAGLIAVFALVKLQYYYIAFLFAFLAYESFTALQALSRGGRW